MTASTLDTLMIKQDTLRDFLNADVKSPTSQFYIRNIQPILNSNDRLSIDNVIPLNNVIAKALCEKFIPLGNGQTIVINVPGGRITAAYPLMHNNLNLMRPERIVMIRQLLKDGNVDERIFLPQWYREKFGAVPLKSDDIKKQFVMCCVIPWAKKLYPKVTHREIFHAIGDDYNFNLRYEI